MHWHRCHKPKDSFLSTSPFRPATQIVLPAGPTKPDRNEDEAEHNKAKRYCIELLILYLISKEMHIIRLLTYGVILMIFLIHLFLSKFILVSIKPNDKCLRMF